jgi:putative ABC transport system permease protein
MRIKDFLYLTGSSLLTHRLRSFLTMLGISVGIAAVIMLTSIGEGIHKFILAEFTQFGTTIVGINPGKTKTMGTSMGVFGADRPLTIEDAEALKRLSFARSVFPRCV